MTYVAKTTVKRKTVIFHSGFGLEFAVQTFEPVSLLFLLWHEALNAEGGCIIAQPCLNRGLVVSARRRRKAIVLRHAEPLEQPRGIRTHRTEIHRRRPVGIGESLHDLLALGSGDRFLLGVRAAR